ncbi:MAG: hypothetical protein ACR2KY_02350 [Thermoleophilaceae bacterium]|jgi:hypothetical protein
MTDSKRFATLLGFAFAAAWIGFGFGDAVLCMLGAGAFYAVASYLEGDLDLAELQDRFGGGGGGESQAPAQTQRRRSAPRVR